MQAARGASLNPSDPGDSPTIHRPFGLLFGIAAVVYAADLVTKILAVSRLSEGVREPLLGDVLQLTLVRNPGAAFSTGTELTVLLTCISAAALVTVLVLARRVRSRLWAFGLGALLGGILGNLTDRLFRDPGFARGHVIDMLMLPNWPVFNIADIFINVAAGVIIVQALRGVALDGSKQS